MTGANLFNMTTEKKAVKTVQKTVNQKVKAKKALEKKVSQGVALSPNLWEILSTLAERSGRSRNNYIEQILLAHTQQTSIK